jgi:hypothetical protein
MEQAIQGMQRKAPKAGSDKGFADHDDWSHCEEFMVKKVRDTQPVSIELFFPSLNNRQEGVGLGMLSAEIAVAVGRALLTVAEGSADEVIVRF